MAEKRLIDANALKVKGFPDSDSGEGIVYVQDIDEAPTVDAVVVVRCKDCIIATTNTTDATGRMRVVVLYCNIL